MILSYDCNSIRFVLLIVAKLLFYVKIIVPILLIVLIVFDLVKVLTGSVDEKDKKDLSNKVAKRFIYAVLVFLIPTIVTFAFNMIAKTAIKDGTPTNWIGCWSIVTSNQK